MRVLSLPCLIFALVVAGGCKKDDFGPVQKSTAGKSPFPRPPAFLDQSLSDLEQELKAAAKADEPRIRAFQKKVVWSPEHEPLIPQGPEAVGWKPGFDELLEYRMRAVQAYEKQSGDPQAARKPAIVFLKA